MVKSFNPNDTQIFCRRGLTLAPDSRLILYYSSRPEFSICMEITRELLLKLRLRMMRNTIQTNHNFLNASRIGEASHPGPRPVICNYNKACQSTRKKISKGNFSKLCEAHLKKRNAYEKKPGARTMVNIEREQLSTEVPPLDESVWSHKRINNVASDLYSFLEVMTPGNLRMRTKCLDKFFDLTAS